MQLKKCFYYIDIYINIKIEKKLGINWLRYELITGYMHKYYHVYMHIFDFRATLTFDFFFKFCIYI